MYAPLTHGAAMRELIVAHATPALIPAVSGAATVRYCRYVAGRRA
jgi:hypothetical protein